MTTDSIKELVKRLDAGRALLLRADGDRDLGFQSNITTDTSMALADELKSATDALEAMAGEVESLKHDIVRHMTIANEAAAERDRLKAAVTMVLEEFGYSLPPDTVLELRKALGGDAS